MTSSWLASALAALAAALGPQTMSTGHPTGQVAASSTETASWPGPLINPDGGNVVAAVPGGSIASSDGIGKTVSRGSHSRAMFQLWVAPNARHAKARVIAVGAKVHACSSTSLQPGVVNYLSCEIRPNASATHEITLTVVASTADLGEFSRSFTHLVRR
jgi:hypothetical protein